MTTTDDWLARLHRDDRGNLAVLLLLTVWVLVALIGLVWNTGEFAARRRHVQTAADSAAHAGNLWVGRTANLTAETNLVISQNGSAEVILRAVPPTRKTIQERFDAERKRATQLRDGSQSGEPEQGVPDCEYFEELLGFGAWENNGRGDQRLKELAELTPEVERALKRILPLLGPGQAAQLQVQVPEHLRRNDVALRWLVRTWIGGADPAKGQPSPTGGGLKVQVGDYVTGQVRPRIEDILKTLDEEQSWLDRWVSQTDPAVNGTTPEQLREIRGEVFAYQQEIARLTPEVVEEQRAALAAFYKCDLTFATPGRPAEDGKPAAVGVPLEPASSPESKTQVDGIRARYPGAALARFKTADPSVTIDPINVNVRLGDGDGAPDSVIWHPGASEEAPPGIVLKRETFRGSFHVGGGEWGRVPCAPLSRYFNDRVSRDREGLREEPQRIDEVRTDLRGRVHPPPAPPTLPNLPVRIADEKTGSPDVPVPPESIPRLPVPDALTAAEQEALRVLNERIGEYNRQVRDFVQDLRGLQSPLQRMYEHLSSLTDSSSQRFADRTWLGYAEQARRYVLREMGWDKQFMILRTYALRPVPEWAKDGMRDDVQQHVYRWVYGRNIGRVTNEARDRIERWAFQILYGQYLAEAQQSGTSPAGAATRARNEARQFANRFAPPTARGVVQRAAERISREVAEEWVQRPWPFEIDPPTESVPPHRGLTDRERKEHFTFLAAAMTAGDSAPRPMLPRIFVPDDKPLVAFAQGETFNWMEYDGNYGAGDPYDRITFYGHGDMGGSPRPWRLSTTGGWHWQPRLALSDALGQAFEDGPEFRSFMEQGGVKSYDAEAVKPLTLH